RHIARPDRDAGADPGPADPDASAGADRLRPRTQTRHCLYLASGPGANGDAYPDMPDARAGYAVPLAGEVAVPGQTRRKPKDKPVPKPPKVRPERREPAPPMPPSNAGEKIAAAALRYIGWGYCTPSRPGDRCVDCSGLARLAVKDATGEDISPSSYEQFRLGAPVPKGQPTRAGDLHFWDTENNGTAGHVAVDLGDGAAISAMNPQMGLRVHRADSPTMGGPYLGARRLFSGPGKDDPMPQTTPPPIPAVPAFGRVPPPAVQHRDIQHNRAWDDLGPRRIKGVVLHRMVGTLWGTDGYFRGEAAGRALTDYGVGTEAADGAAHDGEILRWNDPRGQRSPWASGPVSNPYGDGAAFVARYGTGAVNRDLVSIEIGGNYDTPLSARAFESVAALVAYWADQARVPWTGFPINQETGISFVLHHVEFTAGTGKICPGFVVSDATGRVIERVRAILRQHQTGGVAPPVEPAKPSRVETVDLPAGVGLADLKAWFGPHFDPNGMVSVAWAEEGSRTGLWPALVRFDPPGEDRDFAFQNGLVIRVGRGGARVLRRVS
ncbi:MAG: NlpC/P60 family protein, partial [Pseudomonadota bacterium]|nr:NlpC/P60 family protein [Pseudomonadota bacterium]